MWEEHTQYYCLDWLANICFFIYLWLLAKKNKWGILVSVLGCGFQIGFSLLAHSWINAASCVVFAFMYLRAFWVWDHDGSNSVKSE